MKIDYRSLLPHLCAFLLIIIVNMIYFFPQLENKVVQQGDIVSSKMSSIALQEYTKASGTVNLWNPAQFGGMPILANPPSKKNYIFKLYDLMKLGFSEPLGLYLAGSLMAYLMLIMLGISPWISGFLALGMLFTNDHIMLWEAGHNAKIRTLIFTPLLITGVLYIFEKKNYSIGFVLLALGFSLSFYTRHPQMTYYIMLMFMVYGFLIVYQTIKSKDWIHFSKGTLLVVAAIVLGMGTSATKIWSMYDYSDATMRGKSILKAPEGQEATSSSQVDGLEWEYAMSWSNDVKDLMATFIPGFVGGGSGENVSKKSESYKTYRIQRAPLYWGQLPFTGGPLYLGAGVIFLFVLGLFWVKGTIKWWLGLGTLFIFLLSLGKNFEFLNRIFFDYFPFYSKFRAPQSTLNIISFFVLLLAGLGIKEVMGIQFSKKSKKKKKAYAHVGERQLYISYGICGGIALLIALLGTSFFDFTSVTDARYTQQGTDITPFIKDRKALMQGDAWRSFFIVTIIAGLIFGILKNKISKFIAVLMIGVILLIDLLMVDVRYLNHDNFVTKSHYDKNYNERPIDQTIKSIEHDRHLYRVHDMTTSNPFSSSTGAAAHNIIGGYSPVKMQRASDIIERHLMRNNMQVLNMLNTKYIIINGQDGKPAVQKNDQALGPAWYVRNVTLVESPEAEINALSTIQTSNEAVVLTSEFGSQLAGLEEHTDSTATVSLVEYTPDRLIYTAQANQEGLIVFSEMWYGPNKGWKAYVDDSEVPIVRANYGLRALRVQAGKHEIKFEFKPRSYYLGETISMASSGLLLLMIIVFLYFNFRPKSN